MNPVSSSEDIKPPIGLNGVLKVPAHPSGNMASFTKHICAICGDRSSGRAAGSGEGRGSLGRGRWGLSQHVGLDSCPHGGLGAVRQEPGVAPFHALWSEE
jgi:hypothetical protein